MEKTYSIRENSKTSVKTSGLAKKVATAAVALGSVAYAGDAFLVNNYINAQNTVQDPVFTTSNTINMNNTLATLYTTNLDVFANVQKTTGQDLGGSALMVGKGKHFSLGGGAGFTTGSWSAVGLTGYNTKHLALTGQYQYVGTEFATPTTLDREREHSAELGLEVIGDNASAGVTGSATQTDLYNETTLPGGTVTTSDRLRRQNEVRPWLAYTGDKGDRIRHAVGVYTFGWGENTKHRAGARLTLNVGEDSKVRFKSRGTYNLNNRTGTERSSGNFGIKLSTKSLDLKKGAALQKAQVGAGGWQTRHKASHAKQQEKSRVGAAIGVDFDLENVSTGERERRLGSEMELEKKFKNKLKLGTSGKFGKSWYEDDIITGTPMDGYDWNAAVKAGYKSLDLEVGHTQKTRDIPGSATQSDVIWSVTGTLGL